MIFSSRNHPPVTTLPFLPSRKLTGSGNGLGAWETGSDGQRSVSDHRVTCHGLCDRLCCKRDVRTPPYRGYVPPPPLPSQGDTIPPSHRTVSLPFSVRSHRLSNV
ncbi:hypothetical protein BaRGS_00026175 [Batillaria attramentaria]|uniref:Uncharacterized protein n=1 Tax=Batillaria attramentaria TaxID=370345 RepID=A0ABD0K5N1_9CAEN